MGRRIRGLLNLSAVLSVSMLKTVAINKTLIVSHFSVVDAEKSLRDAKN
jgi:hypothetical protein